MRLPNFDQKFHALICRILTFVALLSACIPVSSTSLEPTQTPQPTYVALSTYTPLPTYTPYATHTPYPTYTPLPTYTLPSTLAASETAEPAPTVTPTTELVEAIAAAEFQNCNDSSGPRQKVRVENTTGGAASLFLYGSQNYLCSIPPGIYQIYVINGNYKLSALMCGDQLYSFGIHVINPTWVITLKCP